MAKSQTSFADCVNLAKRLIIFELVPPNLGITPQDLDIYINNFHKLFKIERIHAVNIPEIINEAGRKKLQIPFTPKIAPRDMANIINRKMNVEFIVNVPIVYKSWQQQLNWFEKTYRKYQINNFILVGGESSKVKYPGISVEQAAMKLKNNYSQKFPQILLGGITIPTRNFEAMRVFKKSLCGLEFFTSQILYEVNYMKNFLKDYFKLCKQNKTKPKMIFLSFAPIAKKSDIKFFKNLRIFIPESVQKQLLKSDNNMKAQSLQICATILRQLLDFIKAEEMKIPLGLNITYIIKDNLELSFDLLDRLKRIYYNN